VRYCYLLILLLWCLQENVHRNYVNVWLAVLVCCAHLLLVIKLMEQILLVSWPLLLRFLDEEKLVSGLVLVPFSSFLIWILWWSCPAWSGSAGSLLPSCSSFLAALLLLLISPWWSSKWPWSLIAWAGIFVMVSWCSWGVDEQVWSGGVWGAAASVKLI
jgi:hypothetical protein